VTDGCACCSPGDILDGGESGNPGDSEVCAYCSAGDIMSVGVCGSPGDVIDGGVGSLVEAATGSVVARLPLVVLLGLAAEDRVVIMGSLGLSLLLLITSTVKIENMCS